MSERAAQRLELYGEREYQPSVAEKLREVRVALRYKYAWPGGYPTYLVMSDVGTHYGGR